MLTDFELIKNASTGDPQRFMSNPVNLYLLTKKLTKDFDSFKWLVKSWWPTHLEDSLSKKIRAHQLIMPSNTDYEGVIKAMHRLQTTYLLDVKQVCAGNLSEKYPAVRSLSALDCFEFGRIAYNRRDYALTSQWMSEALSLIQLDAQNQTSDVSEEDVLDYLAFAKHQVTKKYFSLSLR